MAQADINAKKRELRKRLAASESLKNRRELGYAMTSTNRAILDRAIAIKKDSAAANNRPLTKEERKEVRRGEKTVGQQITIKNDRVKFISQTTASNFEVRDAALRVKKEALKEHLSKVEARKSDYKVVKGIQPKTPTKVPAKATLKAASKDFEQFAKKATVNGNDTGMQTVGMTYDAAKAMMIANAKLTAVNRAVTKGSVKVLNDSVQIGKKTYKIGKTVCVALITGTMAGTLNMYKEMAIDKVGTAIRYSSSIHHIKNVRDGVKTTAWSVGYGVQRSVKLVRGVKNGTIRITAKEAAKYAGTKAIGAGKVAYKVGKGIGTIRSTKIIRGSLKGFHSSLKSVSNQGGNDIGVQAIGTMADSVKYSYQALKMTGRATASVAKGAAKGVYRTSRGTYRFVRDARKLGVKGASKIWYKAHLKGAGKRLGEKISGKVAKVLQNLLKKAMFNPAVLAAVGILLCTVVIGNTAVVSASSVAGGVIEFFEELKEGLQEVWDTVTSKVAEFFENCVTWLKNLFTGGGASPEAPVVDVDIGDSMSICDYLLGAVQLYKAEFSLEVEEKSQKLMNEEGYHAVILYHLSNEEIEIHDINDPDKGLMSDKSYVKAILPVWKAIVLGTLGTDFTGSEANNVSKDCFDALTELEQVPYVDLNGDDIAEFSYCDGSASMNQGENTVYTHIAGVVQSGIHSDTGLCYNNSGTLYHSSHNTEGLACCVTEYSCAGHLYCPGHMSCPGHRYCPGHTGANGNTTYHEEENYCASYTCAGCIYDECEVGCSTIHCYTGVVTSPSGCDNETSYFRCDGYNLCLGHKIMKFYLGSYGFNELLDEKFLNRITELELIQLSRVLTATESQELSQLNMFYEYAIGADINGDPIAEEFFATD